jgi:hypothetical protein
MLKSRMIKTNQPPQNPGRFILPGVTDPIPAEEMAANVSILEAVVHLTRSGLRVAVP